MASSVFLANRNAIIGTALADPGASQYPETASHMYWPTGVTADWPSGALANYTRHKEMWGGRKPGMVRLYNNNAQSTTGTTGTGTNSGTYGLISPDWRAIANDGCFLNISFKYTDPNFTGSTGAWWRSIANNLNATGDNADKQAMRNICQNIKRWYYDTNNTAAIKKIIFGFWHEPENNGGQTNAPYYRACVQAMIRYFAKRGVGDSSLMPANAPLDTANDPGGAPVGGFTDVLEWSTTLMGWIEWNFDFWPGDAYCKWLYVDPYNWGGGQANDRAKVGEVPQPGQDCRYTKPNGEKSNNYAKAWNPLSIPIAKTLTWSDSHPDVLLGLGEFATSEDLDRWPVSNFIIQSGAKNHVGVPGAKGEWFRQVPRLAQGLGPTAGCSAMNSFTADARAKRIKAWIYWPDQAAMPRWWNTVPFQPNDVLSPSTTGTDRALSFDGFRAMVNDPWWDEQAGSVVLNPSDLTLTGTPDTVTGLDYVFEGNAVAGSGTITGYTFNFGDGTDEVTVTGVGPVSTTHVYAAEGAYNVRMTVNTDDGGTNSLVETFSVVKVTGGGEGGGDTGGGEEQPTSEPLSGAPYLVTGDVLANIRFKINPAITALANYTNDRVTRRLIRVVTGTAYTLTPEDAGRIIEFSAATAVTVTIPTNTVAAFSLGSFVDLVQTGDGQITVAGATGVTLQSPSLMTTRARYSTIRVTQRSVDVWLLSGDLTAGTGSGGTGSGITPTDDNLWIIDMNTGPAGAVMKLEDGWDARDTTATDATYSSDAVEGAFSMRVNTTSARMSYREDIVAQALVWWAFYMKLDALTRSSAVYITEWYNGGSKVGDVRLNADRTLTLRDNITAVTGMTSPVIAEGAWVRVAGKVEPGSTTGHVLKLYTGTNLHTMTPTWEASGAATSGAQSAVDTFRVGVIQASTALHKIDRYRGNSTVEPSPVVV